MQGLACHGRSRDYSPFADAKVYEIGVVAVFRRGPIHRSELQDQSDAGLTVGLQGT